MASKLILSGLLVMTGIAAQAQSSIVTRMTNIRNDNGVCRVCLFDKPEAFNGKGGEPVACQVVPVKDRAAEASFHQLAPGTYAVFVFHDANNNNHFDTNWLGIPKEGYGASRNSLPFAAAPSFNSNKLVIADKTITTVNIRLRNL